MTILHVLVPNLENRRMIIDIEGIKSLMNEVSKNLKTCAEPQLTIKAQNRNHLQICCLNCDYSCKIKKDNQPHSLAVNEALVIGAYTAGVVYSAVKNIFQCLEVIHHL